MKNISARIQSASRNRKKLFAVLIDPDKFNPAVVAEANRSKVDLLFIGGSGLKKDRFHRCIQSIKKLTRIPLVIFPGGKEQISEKADALLLLSLISGRNPDYLIGEHIRVAQKLKKSRLDIIPTGYILIGGGKKTSTQRVSRTRPIKRNNIPLAVSTAIAGELLGMKLIYLEAGSGAKKSLDASLIRKVKNRISVPLIAGGGINSAQRARAACKAGADLVVVGNAIEKDPSLIAEIAKAIHSLNRY